MLIIHHPSSYINERQYIFDVIFREFFGVPFRTVIEDRQDVCIKNDNDDKKIIIEDVFFKVSEQEWLTAYSLPIQPLSVWPVEHQELESLLVEEKIPIIYGSKLAGDKYLVCIDNAILLGIDIFGSAFFMLTRYEEVVKTERDEHDRFPATASLAYQEGFLERPIINEYLEILWWALKQLCPELKRRQRQFRIVPTHDVDVPFAMLFLTPYQLVHTLAGDILKRKSINAFLRRTRNAYKVKTGNILADENYTFDLIMDISEQYNLISSFYMMEAQGLSILDGNYSLEYYHIINLLKSISGRGYEIGLHPSYVSYKNGQEIKREAQHLYSVCQSIGIHQMKFGGRQHYLRWQCPDTWQHYEDSGIVYDTTLTYADHFGFRCGICYEYPVFNVKTRRILNLKERPLIVMECSALDKRYMNLSHDEMLSRIIKLKNICRKYNGDFVLLWHNSRFVDEREVELYKLIIQG